MKTQIPRSIFLITAALLITVNNNAGKLEFPRFSTKNIMIETGAVQIPNAFSEKPVPHEPEIHFHMFDIDKDEKTLIVWKMKAKKYSIVIYDVLILTGLQFALYILPAVMQQYH